MIKWLLKNHYKDYVSKLCDNYLTKYQDTASSLKDDPYFVLNMLVLSRHLYFERLSIYNNTLYSKIETKILPEFGDDDLRAIIFFLLCIEDENIRTLLKKEKPIDFELEIIHEIAFKRVPKACQSKYTDYIKNCNNFIRYLKDEKLI